MLTAVLVLVPVAAASPASAATLPPSDELSAFSCPIEEPYLTDFFHVDPDSGASTLVGGTGIEPECAFSAAMDPTTGISYYISQSDPTTLARIDVATGEATPLYELSMPGEIAGLVIALDGTGYFLAWDELYSIDLATGETSYIGELPTGCLFNAVDPTTGLIYAIHCTGAAYLLDVTTATLTPIGGLASDLAESWHGFQIDSSGRWWMNGSIRENPELTWPALFSSATADGVTETEFEGYFVEGEERVRIFPLLITRPLPEPVLPATGTAVPLSGAVMAGLVVLGGALVVVSAVRGRGARRSDA